MIASEQILERVGLGDASRPQEFLQSARVGGGRERSAVLRREIDDARPALRCFDDAADGREAAVGQEPHRHAVGRHHEVLDDGLGAVRGLGEQVLDAVPLDHRVQLGARELECSLVRPPVAKVAGDRILPPELRVEPRHARERGGRGPGSLEPRGDRVVGQLRLVANQRAVDVRLHDRAGVVDRHVADHRFAILVLVERGAIGRELRRQHREDDRGRVNRGGVERSVLIERRVFRHQRVDVGDRDQHARRRARRFDDNLQLIQIPRVVVVDRRPGKCAEILQSVGLGGPQV